MTIQATDGFAIVPTSSMPPLPDSQRAIIKRKWLSETTRIALMVALLYWGASFYIFRGVAASIPLILSGQAVINGDELVPFFNPTSQLIDQAAGKFNQLTNGYEFRVRYSILTTWMRYYRVLPFAIVLVIPGVFYAAYLSVSNFLSLSLTAPSNHPSNHPSGQMSGQMSGRPALTPVVFYVASITPVAVILLVLTYSKITHFYTLILGFSMFLVASAQMTYGLIFAEERPYRPIIIASLITLFNPAVHYLILFALYLSMTVGILLVLDGYFFLFAGGWRMLLPWRRWRRYLRPSVLVGILFSWSTLTHLWQQIRLQTIVRCVVAFVLFALFALLPYGLFVKYFALRGIPNLSETVPGDFYFITDASISYDHVLAFDMAGIMDKMISGDYLSKEPRWPNAIYTVLLLMPLFVPVIRRQVFCSWPRRQFLCTAYFNVFFSMWATLGYSEPGWFPTFHRTLAAISQYAYGMQSLVGDLILQLTSTIVQVLRFPHRFQLILFMMACFLGPISVAWIAQWMRLKLSPFSPTFGALMLPCITLLTLVPLFSSWQYREVFGSGNFRNFLAPYPVTALQEVKRALLQLPPGKVVVLPPTETAKVIVDPLGVEHKFIDKFHIYYLDLPSYYYGLTGDSDNKYEFFLMLRGLYYQQDWWINIARDLFIRYIVINKELMANSQGGAEYLREIEKVILPEFDAMPQYLRKRYENDSYVLYEMIDLPVAARPPLFIDTDWSKFIQTLSKDLNLTRHYDLRHMVVSDDLTDYTNLTLLTDDLHAATLDLYAKANPNNFFGPSSNVYAFSPDIIPSSYYLSPMFRLFQFFSDSKWNRLNLITPGLYGTLRGSFIGLPRATTVRINASFPEAGRYRLFLRGSATVNQLVVNAKKLAYRQELSLHATAETLDFFDGRTVFASSRQPVDVNQYSLVELERLIPSTIVAINKRYQYYEIGVVTAPKGSVSFYFDKLDSNPLLFEGVLAIPEERYRTLSLPDKVSLIDDSAQLCCRLLQETERSNKTSTLMPSSILSGTNLSATREQTP